MGKLRPFDLVAGFGGLVLFASLHVIWYELGAPIRDETRPQAEYSIEFSGAATGWQVFGVTDLVLAAISLLAIAVPIVTAVAKGPAKPVAIAVLATTTTPLAVLLVLWRLIDDPFPGELMGFEVAVRPAVGAWVALAGALIAFVGSFGALKDESTPGAVAPEITRRPAPPTPAA
jgi:hypothetical protein